MNFEQSAQLFVGAAVIAVEIMNPEEHQDPVWQLLAKAKRPEVRPDFASSVLAAAKAAGRESTSGASAKVVASFPFRRRMMLAGGAIAAAALIVWGLLSVLRPVPSTPEQTTVKNTVTKSPVGNDNDPIVDDESLEQELVAVDGFNSLIAEDDPSKLSDAELLALLN